MNDARVIERCAIERCAAAAWAPGLAREVNGWLVRHTPGVRRRRSNAALPLAPSADTLLAGLPGVEEFYAERGLPVTVQVAPAEDHRDLDQALAARGYREDAPTLVRTAPAALVAGAAPHARTDGARVEEEPSRRWLDAYVTLDGNPGGRETADHVLTRIPAPAAYVSVERDGRAAGIGLFAADGEWCGIFCMATDAARRRQGIATEVLRAGAAWAAERGAGRLYLQVTADDAHRPARELYGRAGFGLSHRYHYRIKDQPGR